MLSLSLRHELLAADEQEEAINYSDGLWAILVAATEFVRTIVPILPADVATYLSNSPWVVSSEELAMIRSQVSRNIRSFE